MDSSDQDYDVPPWLWKLAIFIGGIFSGLWGLTVLYTLGL